METVVAGDETKDKSFAGTVQDSRKGDRFHYVWAAVQSLKLLDSRSRLQSLWIEGADGDEGPGDEIIDVVEYYGPDEETISEIIVRQLKYSTQRAAKDFGLADARATLEKFALLDQRYSDPSAVPAKAHATYSLVTNRPIGPRLKSALSRIADNTPGHSDSTQAKLLDILGPDRDAASSLARRISFDSDPEGLNSLRTRLDVLAATLTGTVDPGIPAMLVEAISARASGEIKAGLRLADVALAFRVTVDQLVPAPSMLTVAQPVIWRACYDELADQVLKNKRASLITADGGAGKSTFAAGLPSILQGRAKVVVYDCFGNGQYRAASQPRHRHQDGLVQICSELAALGLCTPLVPAHAMEPAAYMRAFINRLREASALLKGGAEEQHLVVIVDAADNAAIAASAHAGERTFVHDLWQLELPPNVHIALTCRPYRTQLLNPPTALEPIHLPAFSVTESAAMLRTRFADAGTDDAEEFHRQTSGNPRTQALALESGDSVEDCLRALGKAVVGDGNTLDNLLSNQLNRLLDDAGPERSVLERISRLLATLRPRIPLAVLETLSDGSEHLVRSFVSDLGRGLRVADESVQFLDEPTETYFRERYRLESEDAKVLVDKMAALANTDAYVAACLPQVLWEAERYDELLDLGASDRGLSGLTEVEKRQIGQLRTSFALLAAFKLQRLPDIVRLSMLAGRAAASGDRRYAMLRDAADLTGEYLDGATLDELRSARMFPSAWPGAALGSEALMLAVSENREDEARSRLRSAVDSMYAFVRTPRDRGSADIEARQVAHVALTAIELEGAAAGAAFLEQWRPARWVLESAGVVASTLLSRGQDETVSQLGAAARSVAVALAVAGEQQRLGLRMDEEQLATAWKLLSKKPPKLDIEDYDHRHLADTLFRGVSWVAANSVRVRLAPPESAAKLLSKYLPGEPPTDIASEHGRPRTGLLHAYVLRSHLRGATITSEELAPSPPPPKPAKKYRRDSRVEDRARLDRVLPWLIHWARFSVGEANAAETLKLIKTFPTARSHDRDGWFLRRVAAPITAKLGREAQSEEVIALVRTVVSTAEEHSGSYLATDMVACLHGDERYALAAYTCLGEVAQAIVREKQSADQTIDDLLAVTRAAYPYDRAEARSYYSQAVEVASRVGEDGWDRWRSVLSIAAVASEEDDQAAFALASQLARTAEAIEPYLGDGFDTPALTRALAQLTGPRALAFISQWRERRFGSLGYMLYSLIHSTQLFEESPHLSIALAPLADRIDVSAQLAAVARRGELDRRRFEAVQALSWRLGKNLDATSLDADTVEEFQLLPHGDPIPTVRETSTILGVGDSAYQESRRKEEAMARERLKELDLTRSADIADAAAAIESFVSTDGVDALIDELKRRPVSTWGRIARALRESADLNSWQRGALLQRLAGFRSSSRAFEEEVVRFAEDLVSSEATDLLLGQAYPLKLNGLAATIDVAERDLVFRVLSLADPSRIVDSSDDCYKLARTIAEHLSASEAADVLTAVLTSLDDDLDLPPWSARQVSLPEESTLARATATFLWAALADPRSDVRWRATHAVRFLLEYGALDVVEAIARAATTKNAQFIEVAFPFYRMHAVEHLLLAAERATITDPTNSVPLLALIEQTQTDFPDHLRIQGMCARIGHLIGNTALAAAAIEPLPAKTVPWSEMPRESKPFESNAPQSEFEFHYEFDEYRLAPLSASFGADHADVLKRASDLILSGWGWRGSPELDADPRRLASVYEEGEAWSSRGDWPAADDFDSYVAYHAMLTVAGQLLRTETPLHAEDEDRTAFEQWWSDLCLRRSDGLWLSDARRPMPEGLGHNPNSHERQWRWEIDASDFEKAFLGGDGWVTLDQDATNTTYGGYEVISIGSALVERDAATALLASLQTTPSLRGGRLPRSDSEDDEIDSAPYRLRGWITADPAYGGIDKRDPLAESIEYPLPRPADWVCQLHQIESDCDGLSWLGADKEMVVATETWAIKEGGRYPSGPEGTRLRVSEEFLLDLANSTGAGVIVEVRIKRRPARNAYSYDRDDEEMRYIDDHVRYFLYTPSNGWRDYLGHQITRTDDR